jgi:hypothetical protein
MVFSRKRLGFFVVGATALLVTACIFVEIVGLGDFAQPRVVGILSLNEEETRAYAGLRVSGTDWDAVARVAAIDVTTGAEMGTTPAWTGAWITRAVATDPNNDHVWTLHDNGSIVEWPQDLGTYTSWVGGLFEAPPRTNLEMFCDFEILPNGHYVATGIASDDPQYYGFYTYVQPHPANPGVYNRADVVWRIDEKSDLIRSCPRVSTDDYTEEVVFLMPDWSTYSGDDYVRITELYSYVDSTGSTLWGLQYVSGFFLPNDLKFYPDDISAEVGKIVVQSEYLNLFGATANSKLRLYQGNSATLEDTMMMYETRAVDMVNYLTNDDYAGGILWWTGHDNTSDNEIGFITIGN